MPKVSSRAALNDYLRACCVADLSRRLAGASLTVGEAAELERESLESLPPERFEVCELAEPRVDHKAGISVRQVRYSVPASLVWRKVNMRLTPWRWRLAMRDASLRPTTASTCAGLRACNSTTTSTC